jgi:hypothetical protein
VHTNDHLRVLHKINNMAKYFEQGNKQFTNLFMGEILLLLYSIHEFRQVFKDSLTFWILWSYGPTIWNKHCYIFKILKKF